MKREAIIETIKITKEKRDNMRKDIETFRGIGCICIVFFHWGGVLKDIGVLDANFFAHGNYAVDFFFALSAYFLCAKVKTQSPVEFLGKRLMRLYPSYWLGILFIAMVFCFLGKPLPLKQIFVNLTMIQRFVGVLDIDGAHWTMTYELILLFVLTAYIMLKNFSFSKIPFGAYCCGWQAAFL